MNLLKSHNKRILVIELITDLGEQVWEELTPVCGIKRGIRFEKFNSEILKRNKTRILLENKQWLPCMRVIYMFVCL